MVYRLTIEPVQPDFSLTLAADSFVLEKGKPLEVTVNGVHFGPKAPDPGSYVDVTTMRDAVTGRATGASLRLQAAIGTAGCTLAFDRYGDGATLPGYSSRYSLCITM